ncbi:hypothetical protein HDV00_010660 [Rhizophlyctis rosea]|nr:hypothetical protein HDV00_010660 [Rhizophlyctis rosea]
MRCKYEFCWICQGPWKKHGTQWYNCNRFDEKSSNDAGDSQAKSRAALERYLHYYKRYANHEQSAKLDKDLYEKTEKKMEEMQLSSKLSGIEVQFVKKSVEVLLDARTILKWTYPFAYYLNRDNVTAIFEDNQRDLEMAVETLSELLEKPIDSEGVWEWRRDAVEGVGCVCRRLESLWGVVERGFEGGRWKYTLW